jgi:hypothetical protein
MRKQMVKLGDAIKIFSGRQSEYPRNVIVQVQAGGVNVFVSTDRQQLEKNNLDGSSVAGGLKLTSLNTIADGTFFGFQDDLWARADNPTEIEVLDYRTFDSRHGVRADNVARGADKNPANPQMPAGPARGTYQEVHR